MCLPERWDGPRFLALEVARWLGVRWFVVALRFDLSRPARLVGSASAGFTCTLLELRLKPFLFLVRGFQLLMRFIQHHHRVRYSSCRPLEVVLQRVLKIRRNERGDWQCRTKVSISVR